MTFPHYFNVFGLHLHPHPTMEVIAYTGGAQLYFFLRRRARRLQPQVPIEANLWILVGCVVGALFGAKLLAIAESWADYQKELSAGNWIALLGGKTIVGGLLGGWAGVEIAKRAVGVRRSTGDLFVFPLIFGIAAGRVGCFLTGLDDHTHGLATSLPWAIDFGDGVRRHPTQLYEIGWLIVLGIGLACFQISNSKSQISNPDASGGRLFRIFLLSYLGYRFAVEFIKPSDKPILGLSAIQIACAGGIAVCAVQVLRHRREVN